MDAAKNPQELKALLDDADQEASAFLASLGSLAEEDPSQETLGEFSKHGRVLERFLLDLDEALTQIFVAGLAYPDPELPEELASLAERARLHGLSSVVQHALRLQALLQSILGTQDLAWRQEFSREAWEETQRFVAWLRLFKREKDLLMVQGTMAASAGRDVQDNRSVYPTRTLSVWPMGMDLHKSGKLVIYAQDIDTGRYILLRDHLAAFNRDNPVHSPCISRLFQDSVTLHALFDSVVRLEDHPVVARADTWLFRPAFQAIPRLLPVASNFDEPRMEEVRFTKQGELRASVPGVMKGQVRRVQRKVAFAREDGTFSRIVLGETLRFNLTKYLLREGKNRHGLQLAVLPKKGETLVLHAKTDLDGRVFPAQDPTLFRVSPEVLARRAEAQEGSPDSALWLRSMVYLLGGASSAAIQSLRSAMRSQTSCGIAATYRANLARFWWNEEMDRARIEPLVRALLGLLLHKAGEAVNLADLALVLGKNPTQVSPADLRFLDGELVYAALWLTLQADLMEALTEPWNRVYNALYQGELNTPGVGDVCARALLMAELGRGDNPEDDTLPSLVFLNAYRDVFLPPKAAVLPRLLELYQYADTIAYLNGVDARSPIFQLLGIHLRELWQPCADAFADWALDENPSPEVLRVAGEAALMTLCGQLQPWLIA